jgi:Flp pilus assembly protein TadD
MSDLWLQLLPRNSADAETLTRSFMAKMQKVYVDYDEFLLRIDPNSVKAHTELAIALLAQGRGEEAEKHLRVAMRVNPQNDQPHYYLGVMFRQQHKFAEARQEFENALRLNPDNYKAHGNLGMILVEQGNAESAESHFRSALRINPDDSLARECLQELLKAKVSLEKKK